jgi:hypothetical protein
MLESESISPASVIEWDCFKVLAYFSYFRYPLTALEVWKWLYAPVGRWTLAEVVEVLTHSSWLNERVSVKDGFYALGRDIAEQLKDRHIRFQDALQKYKVLAPVLRYIGRLPFVEGVFVCNSLAFHYTNAKSDIDLFIVTKPGRVWTVRLLVVSMMALLRKRPGEAKVNPICCSFFADSNRLDLASLKIDGEDPYLAYWLATLTPMIDNKGILTRLYTVNRWVGEILPNASGVERAYRWVPKIMRRLPTLAISERRAREMQEKKFTSVICGMKNVDTRVVVNDFMLKFHVNDTRQEILKYLEEKLCVS